MNSQTSRGPLGRSYFLDGGCPMPATSAVDPVLPVEGAVPVSAVEHVRPSTGRANERTALPDVPVGGPSRPDDDSCVPIGESVPTYRHSPTMAQAVAAIVGEA